MLRLSGCIEMLYRAEHPAFVDRIAAAGRAGLPAVEFWSWRTKDIAAIQAAARASQVAVAGFAVDPRGNITDPATHAEFMEGVRGSCDLARRLDAGIVIILAGDERADAERSVQHGHIVDALRQAAPLAEAAGVTLCLEPLNTRVNHPGYFLTSSEEGFAIVRAVDSPRVRLLYDIYHQQISEGWLIPTITANIDLIGHFHVADVPGRHEPGTGEINYANLFRAIDESPYAGYVGLEFVPSGQTDTALASLHRLVEAARSPR